MATQKTSGTSKSSAHTPLQKGKDAVTLLVNHYREHKQLYHSEEYKETQARQDLIDPLFIALGWDVRYENKSIAQTVVR